MTPNLIERRPWVLTLLLASLTGLTALSIDMSLPAMPQLQETFGAGVSAVQLTLSVFLARFAQGIGASVGPVVARAIVRDRFDSRKAASVLSQMTQVMIVAPLLAPTLGGYLLVHLGWPSIFFVLGGSGALMCLIC